MSALKVGLTGRLPWACTEADGTYSLPLNLYLSSGSTVYIKAIKDAWRLSQEFGGG